MSIGPHGLRFSLRVQDVLARSSLPEALQRTALSTVFRFLYGFTSLESLDTTYGRRGGSGTDNPAAARDFARGLAWLVVGMSAEGTIRR